MEWRTILFVFISAILFEYTAIATERDPLVRLLIKKGLITEEEVTEMEKEIIDGGKNGQHIELETGKEIAKDEGKASVEDELREDQNQVATNHIENDTDNKTMNEIKSLKYEVKSLHEELKGLKSRKSLFPEPVKIGFGKLKIGGLLQLWYRHDETPGAESGKADTFRLRSGEIAFRGKILPEVSWTVMIDPTKELGLSDDSIDQKTRILQDLHFGLNYIPHHTINVGQFKQPITEEGPRSSSKLDTIQRSGIARAFGGKRDIGLQIRGVWKYVDYWLGVFNGAGQNQLDVNDYKDITGRVVFKPFKGLEIGMSGLTGKTGKTLSDKNRLGGELRYEYKDLSFKGEYLKAKDANLKREGWYTQLGYFMPFMPKLQGVIKYEEFEDENNDEEKDVTIGLNYFIKENHLKFQLNYINRNETENDIDNDQILSALQISF